MYWHDDDSTALLTQHRYEMLTLKHAFQASTLKELIDKVSDVHTALRQCVDASSP